MAFQYTTVDNICRRLRGRLQIGGSLRALGEKQIDPQLVEQIGEQVEARLTAMLKEIYEFPLVGMPYPELASIVEKCTISELIPVYEVSPEGREGDSWSSQLKAQCKAEWAAIANRDTVLEGEKLKFKPTEISSNASRVRNRSSTQAERKAGYEQEKPYNYRKGDKIRPIQADSVRW